MTGKMYGYARVSSKEQNLNRQLDALAEFGDGAGIAMVEFDEGLCREPSPLLAVHVVFLPVPSRSKIPTAVLST